MVGGDVNGVGFGFRTVMSDVGNIVEGSLSDSRGDDGAIAPSPFSRLYLSSTNSIWTIQMEIKLMKCVTYIK